MCSSDLVTTNSFGASPITLGEFGLSAEAFQLSKRSAELVREAADLLKADGRERFVLGDIGPGTKLPTLGHIDYQPLEDALAVQAAGLIAGGADALVLVTEWRQYQNPDFSRLKSLLRRPLLVDGRNIWSGYGLRKQGFTYDGIGVRGS